MYELEELNVFSLILGVLLWEWSLTVQKEDQTEFSEWWVQQGMLVHMLPVFGSHIEVSMYNLMTGHNRGSTSKLPATWTNEGYALECSLTFCKMCSYLLIYQLLNFTDLKNLVLMRSGLGTVLMKCNANDKKIFSISVFICKPSL